MDNKKTGTIFDSVDAGSVVVVFLLTRDGLDVVHADGNLWRNAEELCGPLRGEDIEYTATDWGGLAWFFPLNQPGHDTDNCGMQHKSAVNGVKARVDEIEDEDEDERPSPNADCSYCEPHCDGPHYCGDADEYVELYSNSAGNCSCEGHEFYHTSACQYGHDFDDDPENADADPGHQKCECGCHRAYEALGWGWLGMED